MKTKTLVRLSTLVVLLASLGAAFAAVPLGTAFTYQGKLTDGGAPAQGIYDLRSTIYDAAAGGTLIAGPQTNSPVAVSNGLFSVTLDFGAGVFAGEARWLEIAARTNATGAFVTLAARQSLTATPYALYAANAGTAAAGAVSAASLNTPGAPLQGQVLTYNGSQLAWNNPATTGPAWSLTGNTGTAPGASFLGTIDNQPLELKVNAQRALRLEPNSIGAPNVIGGALVNFVAPGAVGVTIAGGGAANYNGNAYSNAVLADYAVIAGGSVNTIEGNASKAVIGGGAGNLIQANSQYATISGGGGQWIHTNAIAATIGGGQHNIIQTNAVGATIGGGEGNTVQTNSYYGTIGGGAGNTVWANAYNGTVAGGLANQVGTNAIYGAVGGGWNNTAGGGAATVAGGSYNAALAKLGVVGGGELNTIEGEASRATIGGGGGNVVQSNATYATISGGWGNGIQTNASLATVGGGGHNLIQTNAVGAAIGGGEGNTIQTNSGYGTISGGADNTVWANAYFGTVGGGWANAVGTNAIYGSVGGGWNNTAGGAAATVAGGSYNAGLADWATISGGRDSLATNTYATVPGGRNNLAGGSDSFAAGRRAKALHDGAFVWADSIDADFASTSSNQFLIRASGGVGIGVSNPSATLEVAGTVKAAALAVGSSTVVTNLNAELLNGLRATNFWQLGGNSQTTPGLNFIGTTDNQPLEFKVSGQRALRLEPNTNGAPNIIGGAPGNWVAPGIVGSVITGGGVTTNRFGNEHTNRVAADFCFLGGGWDNSIHTNAWGSFLGGGSQNSIHASADQSFLGGGCINSIQTNADQSFLGGGCVNSIQTNAYLSFLGGGGYNSIQTDDWGSFLGGGWHNSIQMEACYSVLGGGYYNSIQTNAPFSFLGGGWYNSIQTDAYYSFLGGGGTNSVEANAHYSFLGGGGWNSIRANAAHAFLGGGHGNTIKANASYATLSGGGWNTVGATSSTVAGGYSNSAAGTDSVVGGGYTNTANGLRSTVPGGHLNVAGGDYSFAAGHRAKAMAYGDFVWADSTDADFSTWVPDQFAIRAAGGVYIQSDRGIALNAVNRPLITRGWDAFDATAPPEKLGLGRWGLFMEPFNLVVGIPGDDTPGRNFQVGKYAPNGTWVGLMLVDQTGMVQARLFNPTSDRTAKENFTPVNPREVLDKLAELPLTQWNFKQDPAVRHLGPVAQDFYAGFGLGTDDKHIATVDADGVALAAIQGLNQKLEERAAALHAENAALKQRLGQLELLVHQLATKGD